MRPTWAIKSIPFPALLAFRESTLIDFVKNDASV
jgi:hypothetical protein